MKKAALCLSVIFTLCVMLASASQRAFAHEEVFCGDVKIVGGWANELPLVNQFNGIILEITQNSTGEPVSNAVAQLEVTVKKGTLTKTLEFQPTEESGVYVAKIIPTQTGQYGVAFRGSISEQACDIDVEIESVEDTRLLEFPERQSGNSSIPTDFIEQLEGVVADLNSQVEQATAASEEAVESARLATEASGELRKSADMAYLFGMVGVGVGVAGIIIGVIALGRTKEKP